MDRIGKKCVLYSRVSTEMQVDGFSLAGQKTCLTNYAKREEMKIIGEYEDAGKSGKSIEGRPAFKRMLEDIKDGLQVDYVIVYKLSRFGRNAADVLNSLELIQDYGVNLICTDEGIDSSQASGRLLISVLSAVAQIERENILEQTMNGRREKARQGLWNGGQAPYGYKLVDGKLVIDEKEAEVVKTIFDKYANTPMKISEVAKFCNEQNLERIPRGNTLGAKFVSSSVRRILENPVYVGKISWGKRTTIKKKGSKESVRVYQNKNIILADGAHEAIINQDLFDICAKKREEYNKKHESRSDKRSVHPLTGLLKCPCCGGKLTSGVWVRKDPTTNKAFYYCKGSRRKEKCDYTRTYDAEICERLVRNAIGLIVNNDKFKFDLEQEFMADNQKETVKQELDNYEKKLKDKNSVSKKLETEIDNMDSELPNYDRKREILNNRLNTVYEEIFELQDDINEAKQKLLSYDKDLASADYISNILLKFNSFYDDMEDIEKKNLLELLVDSIYLDFFNEEKSEISLKAIEFKFPIYRKSNMIYIDSKEDFNSINTKDLLSRVKHIVYFGDNENEIHLDPIEVPHLRTVIKKYEVISDDGKSKIIRIKKIKQESTKKDFIKTKYSSKLIREYIENKHHLVVYPKIIRTVKYELGIKYRNSEIGECTFDTYKISLVRFDAVVDALKNLNLIPEDLKDSFEDRVVNARNKLITILATKKRNNPKPIIEKEIKKNKCTNDVIIEYVQDKYHINVNASMISYVRDDLGIVVKKKDIRYDPTFKNKRIPNSIQYNAIVDAFKNHGIV